MRPSGCVVFSEGRFLTTLIDRGLFRLFISCVSIDSMSFKEFSHFIQVVKFMCIKLFIIFPYYPLMFVGSVVMSYFSFLIICVFSFFPYQSFYSPLPPNFIGHFKASAFGLISDIINFTDFLLFT